MPKYILIVEDDKDIREPLRDLLEVEGYRVTCVSSGKEAIVHLQSKPSPCLVLCDLLMPGMGGAEFIQALKTTNEKFLERTILLSAAVNAEQMATALNVGFIRKPIDVDALLEKVRGHCSPPLSVPRKAGDRKQK